MAITALMVAVAAIAVLGGACGGPSADEIAKSVDNAVAATESHVDEVPEPKAESAALQVACDALGAYGSAPDTSLSDYLRNYAESQRVLREYGLNEVDPDTADRLADAMEAIESSQDAADVADQVCNL